MNNNRKKIFESIKKIKSYQTKNVDITSKETKKKKERYETNQMNP